MSDVGHNRELGATDQCELIRGTYLLLSLLEGTFDNGIEVISWDLGKQIHDRQLRFRVDRDLIFLLLIVVPVVPSILSHLTERIGVVIGHLTFGCQGDTVILADLSNDGRWKVETYAVDLFG